MSPWQRLRRVVFAHPWVERIITRLFHQLYYYRRQETWLDTRWLGDTVLKCPLDAWVLQEILFEVRPDLVIETGTHLGGSATYLASLMDLLGVGRVLSVDVEVPQGRPAHPRIRYIRGHSTDPLVVRELERERRPGDRVLVILDSNHRRSHVAAELEIYARWVSPGSYCIVEDSNINGHPVAPEFGEGPAEAIQAFLERHPRFEADRSREKFFLSFNPGGYLKRFH